MRNVPRDDCATRRGETASAARPARTLLAAVALASFATAQGMTSGLTSDLATEKTADSAPTALDRTVTAVTSALTGLVTPGQEASGSPRWNSQESPRHALLSFAEAMEHVREGKDLWERALSILPPASEDSPGARRAAARDLSDVFDRIGGLDPLLLPGPEMVERRSMRRFQFFPAPKFAWVWKELDEAPNGSIVLERDGSDAWHFTPETVSGAARLLDSLRALPPMEQSRARPSGLSYVLSPIWEETPWWGWVSLFACVFAGVVVGSLARRLLRKLAQHMRERDWSIRASLAGNLASPLHLAAIALAVGFGLGFLFLGEALEDLRWTLLRALLLSALGWSILNLVELLGEGLRRFTPEGSEELDKMLIPLLVKAVRIFLAVLILTAILQNMLGVDVTGFLAGLGIAGLALSLAAKESLQNLLGSLTIFFDKPFRVGDVIRFNGSFGTVDSIGLRSTRIRLLEGDVVIQPNMAFVGDKVENLSIRPHIRRELKLSLPYDTSLDKIEEAIQIVEDVLLSDDVVEQGRFDLEHQAPHVSLCSFEDSYVELRAYYWYRIDSPRDSGWYAFLDHCELVNLRVLRRFSEAGIEITYPTRRVLLSRGEQVPSPGEPSTDSGEDGDAEGVNGERRSSRAPASNRRREPAVDPHELAEVGDDG